MPMTNNYLGFSKGDWVVRATDYRMAKGDVNQCEWLFVIDIRDDDADGDRTVAVEKYDDENGDVETVVGRGDEFVATGMSQPKDMNERIMSGIAALCPNLTDEDWQTVRMMIGEPQCEEA